VFPAIRTAPPVAPVKVVEHPTASHAVVWGSRATGPSMSRERSPAIATAEPATRCGACPAATEGIADQRSPPLLTSGEMPIGTTAENGVTNRATVRGTRRNTNPPSERFRLAWMSLVRATGSEKESVGRPDLGRVTSLYLKPGRPTRTIPENSRGRLERARRVRKSGLSGFHFLGERVGRVNVRRSPRLSPLRGQRNHFPSVPTSNVLAMDQVTDAMGSQREVLRGHWLRSIFRSSWRSNELGNRRITCRI
jgi:hypothetical protein